MSTFMCTASHTYNTFGDYWCDRDSETIFLEAPSMTELYEKIAQYKMRYEQEQAPLSEYAVKQKYANYNDYTKCYFSTIFEVVDEYPLLQAGIKTTQAWTTAEEIEESLRLDRAEKASATAAKAAVTRAANKADAEVRAEKGRAALDRKRNK